jgi:hypothetical protein
MASPDEPLNSHMPGPEESPNPPPKKVYMTQAQKDSLNSLMRSIQRKFVEASLAEVMNSYDDMHSLDTLTTRVTMKCEENGNTFSETLVQDLIIEIAEKLGYEHA